MGKKSSGSSLPEKRRRVRNEDIILNEPARAQLTALEHQPVDSTDPDALRSPTGVRQSVENSIDRSRSRSLSVWMRMSWPGSSGSRDRISP